MKEVILTNGMKTLVDDEDYERVTKFSWYHDSHGYADRTTDDRVRLHRFIMDNPKGMVVDHKNRDKLDNRKENLRVCSVRENVINSALRKDNKSGYKGVTLFKGGRWRSTIVVNKKQIALGIHETKEKAALAYNRGAILYHGEFASLNPVKEIEHVTQTTPPKAP